MIDEAFDGQLEAFKAAVDRLVDCEQRYHITETDRRAMLRELNEARNTLAACLQAMGVGSISIGWPK